MNWKKNWLGTSMLVVGLCVVLLMHGVSASGKSPEDLIKDTVRDAKINETEGLGKIVTEGAKGGMGFGQFILMIFLILTGMISIAYGLFGVFKTQKEGERAGNSSLTAWGLVIFGFVLLVVGAMFSDIIAQAIGLK